MSSKILNVKEHPQLDVAHTLKRYYESCSGKMRFTASSLVEAKTWQDKVFAELEETVGFQHLPTGDFEEELIEEVDRGEFVRRKITIQTTPGKRLPFYLLVPKGIGASAPVALAFHGHGYGVKDIVGLWEDGQERYTAEPYHFDFANALARSGFVVAAPDIMGFGEHQPDQSHINPDLGQEKPESCHLISAWAMMLGGSLVGLRVFEAKRLVDYISTIPFVDVNRLGAMGISGGGMHTFFSTCLDRRIKACVISGYFSSWFSSILAMYHCMCNYVAGVLEIGDLPDLAGLLAPRPVLIEAGTRDGIFPIESVRQAFRRLKEIYSLWGAEGEVEFDEFEGRHRISGRRAYNFLCEKLQA